jgi:hypothetical protein
MAPFAEVAVGRALFVAPFSGCIIAKFSIYSTIYSAGKEDLTPKILTATREYRPWAGDPSNSRHLHTSPF